MPIAGEAASNFSAPGVKTIYDPNTYNPVTNTRLPFPGNTIPASEISPVGQAFARLYPAPNVAGALKNSFILEPTSAARTDQGDGRLDYGICDADQLIARYTQIGGMSFGAPRMPGLACGCGYSPRIWLFPVWSTTLRQKAWRR